MLGLYHAPIQLPIEYDAALMLCSLKSWLQLKTLLRIINFRPPLGRSRKYQVEGFPSSK
jgi:hypothetical protein